MFTSYSCPVGSKRHPTPGITRRAQAMAEDEGRRVAGRVHAVVMPPATSWIRPPLLFLPPLGFVYDFADGGNNQLWLILMNEVATLLGDDLPAPRGAAHKLPL